MGSELGKGQLCALELEKASSTLGCVNKSMAQRVREVIILCSALVKPLPDTVSGLANPTAGKTSVNWSKFSTGSPKQMRARAQALCGEAGQLGLFNLEKDGVGGT